MGKALRRWRGSWVGVGKRQVILCLRLSEWTYCSLYLQALALWCMPSWKQRWIKRGSLKKISKSHTNWYFGDGEWNFIISFTCTVILVNWPAIVIICLFVFPPKSLLSPLPGIIGTWIKSMYKLAMQCATSGVGMREKNWTLWEPFVETHNSSKRDHTLTLLANWAWVAGKENNERPDVALQTLWP